MSRFQRRSWAARVRRVGWKGGAAAVGGVAAVASRMDGGVMRTAQVAAAPSTGGPGAASVPGQHLIDQGEHVVGLVVRVLLATVVLVVIVAVLWQWWRATPRRGMANRWELRRTLSARSARRRMPQTRPSLAALPSFVRC